MTTALCLAASSTYQHRDSYTTYPVVNLTVEEESFSLDELRSIFTLGLTIWPDGRPITVVLTDTGTPARRVFLEEYFGISPLRYNATIYTKTTAGIGNVVIVQSMEEMIKTIQDTPGAIGYVTVDLVDEANNYYVAAGVKVLRF